MIPVLRGKCQLKDNVWIWQGKWAMTVDEFKGGNTSKFRYKGPTLKEDEKDNSIASASGSFRGVFFVKSDVEGEENLKVKEKNVTLEFKKPNSGKPTEKWAVFGKGENQYGKFVLEGTYDPTSAVVVVTKTYDESEDEEGDSEGDFVGNDNIYDDEETLLEAECEPTDFEAEVRGLAEDNELTVEELRAKYGGGGGVGNSSGGSSGISTGGGSSLTAELLGNSTEEGKNKKRSREGEVEVSSTNGDDGPQKKRPKRRGTEADGSEAQLKVFVEDLRSATASSVEGLSASRREEEKGKAMKILKKLEKFDITVDLMLATGVGKLLNKLGKKHPDLNISRTSALLVKRWRKMAAEVQRAKKEEEEAKAKEEEKAKEEGKAKGEIKDK
eukprot:g988.t1